MRGDPKLCCCLRGGDRDVGELFRCGVRVDCAVTVDEDTVFEAHEEHGGDHGYVRNCFDDFEGGADGVCCGVCGTGHHSVCEPELHHHGSEVGHRGDDFPGAVNGDAFVGAELGVFLREPFMHLTGFGVDDLGI